MIVSKQKLHVSIEEVSIILDINVLQRNTYVQLEEFQAKVGLMHFKYLILHLF